MHISQKDFPRVYNLSWMEKQGTCAIVLEINQDASEALPEELTPRLINHLKDIMEFDVFGSDFHAEGYGFGNCAKVEQTKDGPALIFELEEMKDKDSRNRIFAHAATISTITMLLNAIPEKTIRDPLPQFITIDTACVRHPRIGAHSGNISGELNKDVKRFLIHHYRTKGPLMKTVFSALINAASITQGKTVNKELYRAEARGKRNFLGIDCPGNTCGLNTDDADDYLQLIREKKEEDFGMELICHNVDGFGQQIILLAGLAALSDEVKKFAIVVVNI